MYKKLGNWGEFLINKLLHPFAVFVTPSFILALLIYFIVEAFAINASNGLRSLAGAIFPLIIMTYIFVFQKELIMSLRKVKVVTSFFIFFLLGVLLMVLINILRNKLSGIPVIKLVLSGSFAILVFSYVSIRENKMLSPYYGTIAGFLIYIIFFGFPF